MDSVNFARLTRAAEWCNELDKLIERLKLFRAFILKASWLAPENVNSLQLIELMLDAGMLPDDIAAFINHNETEIVELLTGRICPGPFIEHAIENGYGDGFFERQIEVLKRESPAEAVRLLVILESQGIGNG